MRCSAKNSSLAALAGALAACGGGAPRTTANLELSVKRQDLRISVVEGGSIESEAPGKIFNEIEGQVTILRLIPEGTIAKPGDTLFELDISSLVDRHTQQKIQFEQARASRVRADNEFEIVRKQQDSLVAEAELELQFAEIDLEKYLLGDFVQAKQSAEAERTIAEAEIARAQDRLEWSRKLEEKGYLTRTEREADELNAKKSDLDKQLADRKLDVLEKYTFKKQKTELEANLVEARRELERQRARAASAIAQAEADKNSKAATLDLEEIRLKKLEGQIERGIRLADRGGLVVYAREGGGMRGSERPIEEGAQVRERQAIISLPDLTRMMAKVAIHESAIDRIRIGQAAVVRVDAFPNDPYPAVVSKVSGVPDSQNMWMNPDLKVYTTEVRLVRQDPEHLRPGMSCSVEIVVDDLKGAIAVPLQAVRDNGDEHFCFVAEGGRPTLRTVKVGRHNDKLIHVVEGLDEGDSVYLTHENLPPLPPPRATALAAAAAAEAAPAAAAATPAAAESRPTESGPSSRPRRGGANRESMSEEERARMRERFESMTPEQREEMRKRREGREGGGAPGAGEDASRPRN